MPPEPYVVRPRRRGGGRRPGARRPRGRGRHHLGARRCEGPRWPHARTAARWRRAGTRRETGLVIVPGFRFRVVDALVTNFHLPRSSLLLLVSAFAGRERVLAAYAEARARRLPLLQLRRRDAVMDASSGLAVHAAALARPASAAAPRSGRAPAGEGSSRCTRRTVVLELRRRVADLGQQLEEALGVEPGVGGAQGLHGDGTDAARARLLEGGEQRLEDVDLARGRRALEVVDDGLQQQRRALARRRPPPPSRAARAAGPGAASTCSGVSRVSSMGPTSPRMRWTSWGTTMAPVSGRRLLARP